MAPSDKPKTNEENISKSELIKSVKNIAGQDCCRKLHEPCSPTCRVIWRVWIFIIALQLMVSNATPPAASVLYVCPN